MSTPVPSPNQTTDLEVDVQTVSEWLSQTAEQPSSDWALIDCREEDEHVEAAIKGAVLLPMSQWQEVSHQLAELKDKHLVVHCHHGGRSMRVANWLRANGFPSAQSMAGGIDAWSQLIDPSIARY